METLTTTRKAGKSPTKAQNAHERLVAMARELGPAAKFPTVTELRRDLQVSITTLDSVLSRLENQNVIFRKHGHGIYVSDLRQKCVGLVCEPAFFGAGNSPFWSQMVEAARLRALDGGETFRFYLALPTGDSAIPVHSDLVEDVRAHRIQGVIFVGHNPLALEWLEEQGIPTIVFAGDGPYRVENDGAMFVRQALDNIVAKGYRRPALFVPYDIATEHILPAFYSPEAQEFRSHLARLGLACDPHLVWEMRAVAGRVPPIHSVPETRGEQGQLAVTTLFSSDRAKPDALISSDDMMTIGILRGMRTLNLLPGRDIPLVSHTNRGSPVLVGETAGLTLIEVDPAEVVRTLFAQLELRMEGHEPPANVVRVPMRLKPETT